MSAGEKSREPREPLERLFYRPREAANVLGISVRKMHELIAGGSVPSVRLGRTRLVPVAALKRLAESPDSSIAEGGTRS